MCSHKKNTPISGYVNDKETGESLIGVNVIWKEKFQGTTSNTYGFFSLTLPEGEVNIDFSYIGYELTSKTINLNKDIRLNIELTSSSTNIQEVTIVGEETVVERTQSSIVEVPCRTN
jgi:hypothetical protein